jgi:methylglutaconyl-CoA hydratase
VDSIVEMILTGGPEALASSKELIRSVSEQTLEQSRGYTAELISKLRMSEEGQEGMSAFLGKRRPRWWEADD